MVSPRGAHGQVQHTTTVCQPIITMMSHGRNGVSNYRQLDSLFKSLFRSQRRKQERSALVAVSEGNLSFAGIFPSQRASNAESVSMSWRQPDKRVLLTWFVLELDLKSVHVCHIRGSRLAHVSWRSRAGCAWRGMGQGVIDVLHQGSFGSMAVELWNNHSIRHWYWPIHFIWHENVLLQKTKFQPNSRYICRSGYRN